VTDRKGGRQTDPSRLEERKFCQKRENRPYDGPGRMTRKKQSVVRGLRKKKTQALLMGGRSGDLAPVRKRLSLLCRAGGYLDAAEADRNGGSSTLTGIRRNWRDRGIRKWGQGRRVPGRRARRANDRS